VNVQVIADPVGRLVWISPTLPGARHDMGAAREHGIIDALNEAGIQAIADTAYQGGGAAIRVPQRRRRLDPDTGRYRPVGAENPVTTADQGHCNQPTSIAAGRPRRHDPSLWLSDSYASRSPTC
jgi:hypothetical protein